MLHFEAKPTFESGGVLPLGNCNTFSFSLHTVLNCHDEVLFVMGINSTTSFIPLIWNEEQGFLHQLRNVIYVPEHR